MKTCLSIAFFFAMNPKWTALTSNPALWGENEDPLPERRHGPWTRWFMTVFKTACRYRPLYARWTQSAPSYAVPARSTSRFWTQQSVRFPPTLGSRLSHQNVRNSQVHMYSTIQYSTVHHYSVTSKQHCSCSGLLSSPLAVTIWRVSLHTKLW